MAASCQMDKKDSPFTGKAGEVRLITLAPGHFHAALLQKSSLAQISNDVYVYAPEGEELTAHLALIDAYNQRSDHPTQWHEIVYRGNDFMQKMLDGKKGNVVVLAGNNRLKTQYILQSVEAGLNVLSDKPMAIDKPSFEALEKAYRVAKEKDVLLYDIMTERFVDYNVVNRLLMQDKDLFGELQKGTPDDPAVTLNSVHHFYKEVSGKPLTRPAWYYDVKQQGEGIVDVTTHLIDLVHWKCFPDTPINYKTDIRIQDADHWPTRITREQFRRSTGLDGFPQGFPAEGDSVLPVYSNGTIAYSVKGVNVRISVEWKFEAPEGAGDIHRSVIRGSKATLLVLQGEQQQYVPKLYIKKEASVSDAEFMGHLAKAIQAFGQDYKIDVRDAYDGMKELVIHPKVKTGHEDHFAFVANAFLGYLVSRDMPAWENENTLAKYYITTSALELARLHP